mgnify:CR=1 FL=1
MNLYSNGKLLITGEYLVLNGAKALALPLSCGQSLNYKKTTNNLIKWNSYDLKNNIWYTAIIDKNSLKVIESSDYNISKRLHEILKSIRNHNPKFLTKNGYEIETKLNFDKNWGLGSSSTLISNISKLADVDPYVILNDTFGGSGYDIACCNLDQPILYSLKNGKRFIQKVDFNPVFKDNLYFIYLNKKQDSGKEIISYRNLNIYDSDIDKVTSISKQIIETKSQQEFNLLLDSHEEILSTILKRDTIKKELFSDFEGSIKNLGAWGGDFILASSLSNPSSYFINKGFNVVLSFNEMINNKSFDYL